MVSDAPNGDRANWGEVSHARKINAKDVELLWNESVHEFYRLKALKQIIAVISMDLSKAFDSCWPS